MKTRDTLLESLMAVSVESKPAFLADGRLLWISDRDGVPRAWLGLDAVQAPQLLAPELDRVQDLSVSPVGGGVVLAHDRNGDERTQMLWLDVDTGERGAWTRGWEQAKHQPGCFSADGKFFYFSANRRDARFFDLYCQPVQESGAQRLWSEDIPGEVQVLALSPCRRWLLFRREFRTGAHELLLLDTASGETRALHDVASPTSYADACWSADGVHLWVLSDRDRDFMHISRLNLESGQWIALVTAEHDVEAMALAPDHSKMACLVNLRGSSELQLHTLQETGAAFIKSWFPAADTPAILASPCFSPDGNRLACVHDSSVEGSAISLWDVRRNGLAHLVKHPRQVTALTGSVPPQVITYSSFDGRQIPAWWYMPHVKNGAQAPAVVYVHGGPASQYRPSFDFFAQYLVRSGYAVLAPNVRGSTGYGKAYTALDDLRLRPDAVEDLGAAADWLRARADIDADRVAVYGRSYGGFMVLATLTRHPHLWAAGINIVGIGNLVSFLENTSEYRRPHREAEYGSLAHDRDFLQEISPVNRIDAIRVPLLVMHGRNDPRVPVTEAEHLAAALRARGRMVELLIFEDEGHAISKRPNKESAFRTAADFINRTIGD